MEIIIIKTLTEDGKGFSQRPGIVPTASHVFTHGEKILVLGKTIEINKLKNRK
ncbi:hypothetical protein ACFLSX_00745 [Calditrichota bacterium]